MKGSTVIWLLLAGLCLVALFADGGVEVDALKVGDVGPLVEWKPIGEQTIIEQQMIIENQTLLTVIEAPDRSTVTTAAESNGLHLLDFGPGECPQRPGDTVESVQGNGACYVWNGGQRYFVNPSGGRWPVAAATAGDCEVVIEGIALQCER